MSSLTSSDLAARYGDLSGADVSRLDAAAASLGLDTERLMEHAGWQVARTLVVTSGPDPCRVVVVCGGGNNGGDGVVAARLLSTWGSECRLVVFADLERLSPSFLSRLSVAGRCGVEIQVTCNVKVLHETLAGCDVALDALLGAGLTGQPREEIHPVIDAINMHRVLSVDVPSGLDATTGEASICVQAFATCTLTAMKSGLWADAGRPMAGRILVGDIGMPRQAWHDCGLVRPTDIRNGDLVEVIA